MCGSSGVSQRVKSPSAASQQSLQLPRCVPKLPELFKCHFSGKKSEIFLASSSIYWKRVRGKPRLTCSTCLNVARNGLVGFVQGFCGGRVLRESPGASSQCGFGAFFPLIFIWSWLDKWELGVRRVCVVTQQTCSREAVGIRSSFRSFPPQNSI